MSAQVAMTPAPVAVAPAVAPAPLMAAPVAAAPVVAAPVPPQQTYVVQIVNGVPTYVPVPATPAVPEKKTRQRREITEATLGAAFAEVLKLVDDELKAIAERKEQQPKSTVPTGSRLLRQIGSRVKKIQSDTTRLLTSSRKKTRRPTSNPNGGFRKLQLVTDAMADFAKRPHGDKMSRIEISQLLCKYIKENGLKDQKEKKFFTLDQTLAVLLRRSAGDRLTYCNLQQALANVFEATPASVAAAASASSAPADPAASASVAAPAVVETVASASN